MSKTDSEPIKKPYYLKLGVGMFYLLPVAAFLIASQLEVIDIETILELSQEKPIIITIVITVAALLFFPTNILGITAGFLIHPVLALIITLTGLTLAGLISFYLGRYFFRDFVAATLVYWRQEKLTKILQEPDQQKLTKTALFLRVIPAFPYNLVNYGFALTKIKAGNFLLATILGLLPKTAFNVFLGGAIQKVLFQKEWFFVALFLLSLIVWFSIYKFFKKKP